MDDHDFQLEHNVRFDLPIMKNEKHFTIVIKLGECSQYTPL